MNENGGSEIMSEDKAAEIKMVAILGSTPQAGDILRDENGVLWEVLASYYHADVWIRDGDWLIEEVAAQVDEHGAVTVRIKRVTEELPHT